ncbi:hypothetical protein DFH06DRAFT_1318883 [Mycena polygramma]|nr:hypothetical protein DFH06DRAFT_1318883 [Mycena polygramma]
MSGDGHAYAVSPHTPENIKLGASVAKFSIQHSHFPSITPTHIRAHQHVLPQTLNFLFFATLMATAIAGSASGINRLEAKENCNNNLGRCDQNGCAGIYNPPNSLHGTCTEGSFKDCPCNRCGDSNGGCNDNGCFGENGACTQGIFAGCPCNE